MKVICTNYINCKDADKCIHSKPHKKKHNCGGPLIDLRYCLFTSKYVSCQKTVKEIRKEKILKINESNLREI